MLPSKQRVVGSNPTWGTISSFYAYYQDNYPYLDDAAFGHSAQGRNIFSGKSLVSALSYRSLPAGTRPTGASKSRSRLRTAPPQPGTTTPLLGILPVTA
jgi:hypothetical protein